MRYIQICCEPIQNRYEPIQIRYDAIQSIFYLKKSSAFIQSVIFIQQYSSTKGPMTYLWPILIFVTLLFYVNRVCIIVDRVSM